MKNLLILIVAIALFLHFYPQPEVERKYEEYKTMVLGAFSEATDTNIRLRSEKIYEDVSKHFDTFTSEEISKLKEITLTRAAVKSFYAEYCSSNKGHAIFHSTNLKKICNTITNYETLL